ncbi:MAG: hypothetical protein WC329_07080 [Candidatus Omnitrophota bacterium]
MRKRTAGIIVCQLEDSCLRIAGLSRRKSRKRALCLLAEERLPIRATDTELSRDIQSILNKLLPITPECLIVSVPRNRVTWKHLRIPSNSSGEIEQACRLHAGRLMLLPEEEVVSVCEIISRDRNSGALVSLMAASRSEISRYCRLFGFFPADNIYFHLSTQGISGIFREIRGRMRGLSLVLVPYRHSWDAVLLNDGAQVYARSFSVPASGNYFGILAAETRAVLDYYSREVDASPVGEICLLTRPGRSGATEAAAELSGLIGVKVDVVSCAGVFAGIRGRGGTGVRNGDGILYVPLIGLSFNAERERRDHGGDFSLPEIKTRRLECILKRRAVCFVAAVALLTSAVSAYLGSLTGAERRKTRVLAGPLGKMEKAALPVLRAGNRMFRLRERDLSQEETLSGGLSGIREAAGNNGIVLSGLVYERGKRLVIQGRQKGWDSLKEFVPAVARNPVFRSWKPGELRMERAAEEGTIIFRGEWVK